MYLEWKFHVTILTTTKVIQKNVLRGGGGVQFLPPFPPTRIGLRGQLDFLQDSLINSIEASKQKYYCRMSNKLIWRKDWTFWLFWLFLCWSETLLSETLISYHPILRFVPTIDYQQLICHTKILVKLFKI